MRQCRASHRLPQSLSRVAENQPLARMKPSSGEEIGSGHIGVDLASVGISPNARTFALKVRGNSMVGAHILDGDTIIPDSPLWRFLRRGEFYAVPTAIRPTFR